MQFLDRMALDEPPANEHEALERPAVPTEVLLFRAGSGRPLLLAWREQGRLHTRPVVDVAGLAVGASIAVAVLAAISRLGAGGPPANRTTITMGPGGWVSYRDGAGRPHRVLGLRRGGGARPPTPGAGKPAWARVLRADRFS